MYHTLFPGCIRHTFSLSPMATAAEAETEKSHFLFSDIFSSEKLFPTNLYFDVCLSANKTALLCCRYLGFLLDGTIAIYTIERGTRGASPPSRTLCEPPLMQDTPWRHMCMNRCQAFCKKGTHNYEKKNKTKKNSTAGCF